MTDSHQMQLGTELWAITKDLLGEMNAEELRDYMLAFLFLHYLSDNYERVARSELGLDDLNPNEDNTQSFLAVWYEQNPRDVPEFEKKMRLEVKYVLRPQHLWIRITQLAQSQDEQLLNTLHDTMEFIENESFKRAFTGLFTAVKLGLETLGTTYSQRNTKLCSIIKKIATRLANFSSDSDTFGDAFEYLIGYFAANSIDRDGEFYTPSEISDILSNIVVLDAQDPKFGTWKRQTNVLDFACGTGSLLLNVRKRLGPRGVGKIYGQEKNITTYNLARMNMLLHGVKDSEFELYRGDTLANDWNLLLDKNPAKPQSFEVVVANPPFSSRWAPDKSISEDFRFKNYGLTQKSTADFAFLLHGFHYLKNDGVMAVIIPHGVLFRDGAEAKIRRKLVDDGHIDTIIALPSNLFYSTGLSLCILVLKKCKRPNDVLFINAARHFEKGKRQNRLTERHVEQIIDTYRSRPKNIDRYARRVDMDEIRAKEYNLNISRYVRTAEVDLLEIHKEMSEVEQQIHLATKEHNRYLIELGLPQLPIPNK